MAERRRGTQVPQRWWEQSGIDWRLVREKAAVAAARAGANEAELETPGSGSEAESEPAPTPGWNAGGTRRRLPWGSVDPEGRSGAGRRIELIGQELKQDSVVPK